MPNPDFADTFICRLPQYGLLSVQSADNLKFLQGQLTCDVREVSAETWRYGALCTNKGRMISNFLLLQAATQQHLLRLPRSTLATTGEVLKKFAPFYKGTIQDVSAEYMPIGIAGPQSAARVAEVFSVSLPAGHQLDIGSAAIVIKLDEQRYECWVKTSHAETCWKQLAERARCAGETSWDLLNIRAGLGEVREATVEAWTPHMLNLQAIGAVNFKKGCYTGQEIVARTEYRGQQKRAMYRIAGSGNVPAAGSLLMDNDTNAGEIVIASALDAEHWEALAVISDPHPGNPLLCEQGAVQWLTLPYSFRKTATASTQL